MEKVGRKRAGSTRRSGVETKSKVSVRLDEKDLGFDVLSYRGIEIQSLSQMLAHGGQSLSLLPAAVKSVIREGMWSEFKIYGNGEVVQHSSFAAFVEAKPPTGLGSSVRQIRNLCRDDMEACDLIDAATQNEPGRPSPETFDNVQGFSKAPTGNTRAAALRRLRKKRSDLHRKVLAGKLSPHRAMVEAGFRKELSPYDQLVRWWKRASRRDRERFLKEVAVRT